MEVKADIVHEYVGRKREADPRHLPSCFIAAMDLAPEAHADTQSIIQRWVDSSISKPVHAPRGYAVDQVESVYRRLYHGGAKGGTVYVDGSRDSQVLTLKAEENYFEGKSEEVTEEPAKPRVVLMYTIQELENTNVTIAAEIGDKCQVCREGHVADIGGCNTCTSCGAQLKCGL